MKGDIVSLKAKLANTSAMDEFAKWAKTRRRLDKVTADYDAAGKPIECKYIYIIYIYIYIYLQRKNPDSLIPIIF
jgi:hypothetical protein